MIGNPTVTPTPRRRSHRATAGLIASLVLLAALAAPAPAAAAATTMTETTVITSTGLHAAVLHLPRSGTLHTGDFQLDVDAGKFAVALMVQPNALIQNPFGNVLGWSMLYHHPNSRLAQTTTPDPPLPMAQGALVVYLLTNGTATLTFEPSDVDLESGTTYVTADRPVEGMLTPLDHRCATAEVAGACPSMVYGSKHHDMTEPGAVGLFTFSNPGQVYFGDIGSGTGSSTAVGCQDPWLGPTAPEEEVKPDPTYGCALTPTEDHTRGGADWAYHAQAFVLRSNVGNISGVARLNPLASGDVYTGWVGHLHAAVGDPVIGSYTFNFTPIDV